MAEVCAILPLVAICIETIDVWLCSRFVFMFVVVIRLGSVGMFVSETALECLLCG